MSTSRDEQVVREFLAPLRGVQPVQHRQAHQRSVTHRVPQVITLAVTALGAVALVAVIALIAHRSSSPAKPHPSGRFARMGGWIALNGVHVIGIDPAHRSQTAVITSRPGDPLAWSNDRSKLLVDVGGGKAGGLYVIREDGREVRIAPKNTGGGSFTLDGGHVIYSYAGSIFKVSASGGRPIVLAKRGQHSVNTMPGFTGEQLSPDGTTIVYNRATGIHPSDFGIWLMDADGRNRRALVSYQQVVAVTGFHSQLEIFALAWYPDSRRVLLIAAPLLHGSECAVLTVNRDGSGLRRFGPPGFCPIRAAAEAGGSHFAFTGVRRSQLLITDLNGRTVRFVKEPLGFGGQFLAWAPRTKR